MALYVGDNGRGKFARHFHAGYCAAGIVGRFEHICSWVQLWFAAEPGCGAVNFIGERQALIVNVPCVAFVLTETADAAVAAYVC